MKLLGYLVVFIISIFYSYGQVVSNVKATHEDDVIAITYDLQMHGSHKDVVSINLYASHDNYKYPLEDVYGDVGNNVSPGMNKKISWNYRSELRSFDDFIDFKVISKMAFSFPTLGKKLKRGKEYLIEWSGGGNNERLTLELLDDGNSIEKSEIFINNGKFSWEFPTQLTPGRNYQLRLVNTNSPQETSTSESFKIKRKMPWGVRIPLAVIVGGGIYYILQAGEGTSPTEPGSGLPEPVLPDDIIN